MAVTRRSIVWVDANGFTTQTQPIGNATLAGIQTALLAKSNADVSSEFEGALTVNTTPAPVAATFQSVKDAAFLTFTTTTTSLLTVTLPAPVSSIFFADNETVDPTQIAAIIAAVVGTAQTLGGATATAYLAGIRRTIV